MNLLRVMKRVRGLIPEHLQTVVTRSGLTWCKSQVRGMPSTALSNYCISFDAALAERDYRQALADLEKSSYAIDDYLDKQTVADDAGAGRNLAMWYARTHQLAVLELL